MTYAEKLRDPRWKEFRQQFLDWRAEQAGWDNRECCDSCGEDTSGTIRVHHKVYVRGREPWEYNFEALRAVCRSCHETIHSLETRVREFILELAPHQCGEFEDFMDELEHAQSLGLTQIALARSKNEVRSLIRTSNLNRGVSE